MCVCVCVSLCYSDLSMMTHRMTLIASPGFLLDILIWRNELESKSFWWDDNHRWEQLIWNSGVNERKREIPLKKESSHYTPIMMEAFYKWVCNRIFSNQKFALEKSINKGVAKELNMNTRGMGIAYTRHVSKGRLCWTLFQHECEYRLIRLSW